VEGDCSLNIKPRVDMFESYSRLRGDDGVGVRGLFRFVYALRGRRS
jgi:hypothetical protein